MDNLQHKALGASARGADLLAVAEAVDCDRCAQPQWADLRPDTVEVTTRDGATIKPDTLAEAREWARRQPEDQVCGLFVRWTEGGRPAGEGMHRIAVRLGRESELWVGAAGDEAAVAGMTQILERTIRARLATVSGNVVSGSAPGVSFFSGPPLALPTAEGQMDARPRQGVPEAGRPQRGPRALLTLVLAHPWTVTIVGGLIATVLAAWIISALGVAGGG